MKKKIIILVLLFMFLISFVSSSINIIEDNDDFEGIEIIPPAPTNISIEKVNSSEYWDDLDIPTDITNSEFWANDTSIVFDLWNSTWDTSAIVDTDTQYTNLSNFTDDIDAINRNLFDQVLNSTSNATFYNITIKEICIGSCYTEDDFTNYLKNQTLEVYTLWNTKWLDNTVIGNCSVDQSCTNVLYETDYPMENKTLSHCDNITGSDFDICTNPDTTIADTNVSTACGNDEVMMGNDDLICVDLNATIDDRATGLGDNSTWNQSFANTLYAPNSTAGIQFLINGTGVYSTANSTYDAHVTDNTQAHSDYMLNTGDTASGNYNFDSNTLVVDAANNRVGVGIAAPETGFHVFKSGATSHIRVASDTNTAQMSIWCPDELNAQMQMKHLDGRQWMLSYRGETAELNRLEWLYYDTSTWLRVMTYSTNGNIGLGGVLAATYPLEVASNVSGISIWSQANVSATGYITRTSVFDKSKNPFDYIKDADYYLTDSKINHSKFYGYAGKFEITDYSIPETKKVECEGEESSHCSTECINGFCDEITYPYKTTEEGVLLDMEVDVLRQAVFELKQENQLLKDTICKYHPEDEICIGKI